jgi:hypothetical protein
MIADSLTHIQLLLTGSACGLTFWELLKGLAVPSGGETSAGHAAIFIFLAGLSGLASAISGLTALCFKFDLLEALEPESLRFGRLHYYSIYLGVLYLIIGSFGSWASIILDIPPHSLFILEICLVG